MVLVEIVPIVREDDIRRELLAELVKELLDFSPQERKEPIPEVLDDDL